jgi:hypothetical protein
MGIRSDGAWCSTGKLTFRSKGAAKKRLREMNSHGFLAIRRVYKCAQCGGYHLTSIPVEDYGKRRV